METSHGFTKREIEERGHPVWAEIDLGALRHNIKHLRAKAPGAEVMGVVKGYAYGHGNPACAEAMLAAGATRLGVARLAEGLHLREAGISAPIHLFTEPPPRAAATLIEQDLTATLYTQSFAGALSDAASAKGVTVPVHVKVDTGMHRVGLLADDAPRAMNELAALPGIDVQGAWSHLAVADVPDHPFTRKQLELFAEVIGRIERAGHELRYKHIANSAATISIPDSHYDIVRCGVAAYGLIPGELTADARDLRPVLSLRARINMTKPVQAGEKLSYGLHYELAAPGRVVTVPAGYADGYDRRLTGSDVLLGGTRYRVSGTICMDQFMVDVGDDDFAAGEVVTLIGGDGSERVSVEELALKIGTINYEVTTRIPSRVPRVYIDEAIA